jgi:hypothetical protein
MDSIDDKKINILGTYTRYHMKKLINLNSNEQNVKKKNSIEIVNYDTQLIIINEIRNEIKNENRIMEKARLDISKKLSSYKQQDILKNRYEKDIFIKYTDLVNMLDMNKLKCHYCLHNVYILYDIKRDNKQWTLDRIDNNKGHNINNVVISCLECNLKRRNTNKDAFMFTKNLIVTRDEY